MLVDLPEGHQVLLKVGFKNLGAKNRRCYVLKNPGVHSANQPAPGFLCRAKFLPNFYIPNSTYFIIAAPESSQLLSIPKISVRICFCVGLGKSNLLEYVCNIFSNLLSTF